MASFTQDNRPLRVTTGLGKDALLLEAFTGDEHVSSPFRFTLEMLSENASVDPAALLRKPICVSVVIPGGKQRHFHGMVSRFVAGGRRAGLASYRAEMVPQLWFLSLWHDCRIFQNQSVPDIISKVLTGVDFKLKLMGSYAKRVYCVQYRESNLAFISRLMEEEGIFYFHEHTDSAHTLVITDHPSQVPACPEVSKVRMAPTQSGRMAEEPLVTAVEMEHSAITEKIELRDYDFEKPSASLAVDAAGKQKDEVYDYPGNYATKGDGDRYARLRLEQKESERDLLHGQSNAASMVCGHKVDLTEHANKSLNQSYHLLRVRHSATIGNYTVGDGEYEYLNAFDAIPSGVPYRPPLVTPRAVVRGSQTAVVVGPGGEEIYVDKFARVKVQFHWDRQGKKDASSSCWVRVSSAWAGKNWGMINIPRIGQEVIVDFLEGDPDRPIITGRVYNADQMPPYDLPGNMTQAGMLTRSSKGGSAANANWIRFEDKKGSEEVFIHAEKDEKHEVEHDRADWVGHDEEHKVDHDERIKIGNDQRVEIGHDRTENVVRNEQVSVGGNRTESVGGNEGVSVSGNRTVNVDGNDSLGVGGGRSKSVGKDENNSVNGARSTDIGKDETLSISGNRTETVGKDAKLDVKQTQAVQVGKDYALKVGKKLLIDAGDEITIKTGSASISMKKNGEIQIKGKDITVNGSGKVSVKASSDVTIKGSKIQQN